MSRPAHIPILVNTTAGKAALDTRELAGRLGADPTRVCAVEPAALYGRVTAEAAAGHALIGVAGGDGSMRTAASALLDTDSALLAVPTGTLNHFAQRCGIDHIDAAAAALRDPQIRTLPVGECDGDCFLNTLTIGEYARIVRVRERWRGLLGKWPAALIAMIATALTRRIVDLTMTTEGRTLERRTPFLWIGVGWGSFPRVPEALERRSSPDLEIAVLRSTSKPAVLAFMLRVGWRMLRGEQPVRDRALEILHTRSLTIAARHTIDATADGEALRLQSPLHIRVRDDALRVVARGDAAAALSV